MGLSLHIHSHAPASLDSESVRALVTRWHGVAETFASEGRIDHVYEISGDAADLDQFATAWIIRPHSDDPDTATGVAVPPGEGWIFLVQLGKGCEPFVLGLCRYPTTAKVPDGWRLVSSCKTHYASLHGWEHFRRCHVAAIDLAAVGQSLGADIRIEDEGGYWPSRDEAALKTALERLNRITAALAGGLKDRLADEADNGQADGETTSTTKTGSVESPIFGHPDFERLEAEAYAGADADKIAAALRVIGKKPPR